MKKVYWHQVRVNDEVMIDNFEDGKFPNASPRFSGPFIVDSVYSRVMVNKKTGFSLCHYPDNLYLLNRQHPMSPKDNEMLELANKFYPCPASCAISSDLEAVEHSIRNWHGVAEGISIERIHRWFVNNPNSQLEWHHITETCALCMRAFAISDVVTGETSMAISLDGSCDYCVWKKVRGVTCTGDTHNFSEPHTVIGILEYIKDFLVKRGVRNYDDYFVRRIGRQ